MSTYIPPLPPQAFLDKRTVVSAAWLNAVDNLLQGNIPASGIYNAAFLSGQIQVTGPNGYLISYGDLGFSLASPGVLGTGPFLRVAGAGKTFGQIGTDAQLPNLNGINLSLSAGDVAAGSSATYIGGNLLLIGGGGALGAGGIATLQGGTSANGPGGNTFVQGGNATLGVAGNLYLSGGLAGPTGGGSVHLIMTDTGAGGINVGSIVFRVNSTVLWTITREGALFLGATGAGTVGQVVTSQGPNAPLVWASPGVSASRIPAEIALGINPTNFNYLSDPWVDPRRYGADPTNAAGSVGTTTSAVQTAINVAYLAGTSVMLNGMFQILPVSLLMPAVSDRFRMFGMCPIGGGLPGSPGSGLVAAAGQPAGGLLTFTGGAFPAGVQGVNLRLENFSIIGSTKVAGVHGLSLQGLAFVHLAGVNIWVFDSGVDAPGLEIALINSMTKVQACNTGIKLYQSGSSTANLITISDCVLNGNSQSAVDYNGGTGLYMTGCDIEANGTPGDVTTGGVIIRANQSPDLGEGHVVIEKCWFENNRGWAFQCAAAAFGFNFGRVKIASCEFIGAEQGREILFGGSLNVVLEDLTSVTPDAPGVTGSTYQIAAPTCWLLNVQATHLNTAGVTTLKVL